MGYSISGKIKTINEVKNLRDGAKAIDFLIDTGEQYNNLYTFGIFKKADKVEYIDKFVNYNNEGDLVTVEFNIRCSEYNGKYYTNLDAWQVKKIDELPKAETVTSQDHSPDRDSDLPF
jgi:predicted SnoaL-like aldol condensation-catalyzing enzyme